MQTSRRTAALAALAVALATAPLATDASSPGTFGYILTQGGNQTQPSIDGQYVVYVGPATTSADGTDVFLFDLSQSAIVGTVAGGPGDQDDPDIFGTVVAYRSPDGMAVQNWLSAMQLVPPARDGLPVSRASVGSEVAAWEVGPPGSRDIVVSRFQLGASTYRIAPPGMPQMPGDQHSPSAAGTWVAYVDENDGGAVWLHDSATGAGQRLCPGAATGVALGEHLGHLVAAVTQQDATHDADVEIWDESHEIAALHVAGEQRNPHVSGEWVAFEDLSTGHSQVVVWHWTTGLVFVPHPSEFEQQLNDLFVAEGQEVRVVFADDANGDFDIALYRLPISAAVPDGGATTDWPPQLPPPPPPVVPVASCDDLGSATILATLELGRDTEKPEADARTFAVPDAPGGIMPILLCVEADRVSAGWIAVDDEAVATPSDFDPSVTRLSIPFAVKGPTACVAGVIAGKPGAQLVVRVLADPERDLGGGTGSAAQGHDAAPDAAASGCATGSAGGTGSLAAFAAAVLALAFLRRRT